MTDWRRLDWLPDYEISEDGFVRRITAGKTRPLGHMPKGRLDQKYRKFKLMMPDGTKKTIGAHRLVCEAWHGPPPPGGQVAHWDGNRTNNHFRNLRWTTTSGNSADRVRHRSLHGECNGRAVVNDTIVRRVRFLYTGRRGQIAKLARRFGLSHSAMSDICHRRHWEHGPSIAR